MPVHLDHIKVTISGAEDCPIPPLLPVEQRFPHDEVLDVSAAVRDAVTALPLPDLSGRRIAVTAGSRGTTRIVEVLAAIIGALKERGADPFIVPAMGSHGGATAEGQIGVLSRYGITEESVGAPIRASMEVVEAARLEDGTPLFCDKYAFEADGIVVFNKVKPHPAFRGDWESGLAKMMAIGLGKHRGATTLHEHGFVRFADLMPSAAKALLARLSVVFGFAVVENAYDGLAAVAAMAPDDILPRERELLAQARRIMGRLLLPRIDVLIVDEMGKNFGGSGMDSNVTGRAPSGLKGDDAPPIHRIFVRGLSQATHGNGLGIGMADVTTRRCAEQLDLGATYTNSVTAGVTENSRLPMILNSDREALIVALRTCERVRPEAARVVRIPNTKHLERIQVSEACLADIQGRPELAVLGPARPLEFDGEGYLTN